MQIAVTPLQALFLWRLLAAGGGEFQNVVKPPLDPRQRKALSGAGLVVIEKRKIVAAGQRTKVVNFIALTEKGWEWAAEHLDHEVSTRSNAGGAILRMLLSRLKTHLERSNTPLADFISPPVATIDLVSRMRTAYRHLTGGEWNARVRLADLRKAIGPIRRSECDDAIRTLEKAGKLVLYSLDDPQQIRPDDEAAAIPDGVGRPRHIVYMES